jgi:hypothetical protein
MQEVPAVVNITASQHRQQNTEPCSAVDNDVDTAYTEIVDDDMYSFGKPLGITQQPTIYPTTISSSPSLS